MTRTIEHRAGVALAGGRAACVMIFLRGRRRQTRDLRHFEIRLLALARLLPLVDWRESASRFAAMRNSPAPARALVGDHGRVGLCDVASVEVELVAHHPEVLLHRAAAGVPRGRLLAPRA